MSEDQRAQPTALEVKQRRRATALAAVDKAMEVAASHITRERFAAVVLGAFAKAPKLEECTPASLALSLMVCAQYGLEPNGPMGHAYLIPRNRRFKDDNDKWHSVMECSLMLGYRGMAELARRSGEIQSMDARVIYADETASITAGSDGLSIRHEISLTADRSGITPDNAQDRIIGAYASVTTKNGGRYCEFLTIAQIEDRRKRGASGETSKFSKLPGGRTPTPWDTDYAAMARKSALRALLNGGLVPLSAEIASVIDRDEAITIDADGVKQGDPTPRTVPGLAPVPQIEAPAPDVLDARVDPAPIEVPEWASGDVPLTMEQAEHVTSVLASRGIPLARVESRHGASHTWTGATAAAILTRAAAVVAERATRGGEE